MSTSLDPDIQQRVKQLVAGGVKQDEALHQGTKFQLQRNMANLDKLDTGFKADASKYGGGSTSGALGYTLLNPESNANLTKLAPLAAGAALAPFTGGLSLGAAAGITGIATGAAEIARQAGNISGGGMGEDGTPEQYDPLRAVKEGAIAGGTEYIGGKALKFVGDKVSNAVLNGGDNILTKAGNSIRKAVTNPSVGASPFGAAEEQRLADIAQNTLKLKGSAANQYSQLGQKFDELGDQVAGKLKSSSATISKDEIMQNITEGLDNSFANVDDKAIATIQKNLEKIAGSDGTIPIQDLYKYKQSLGNVLKRAFSKLDSPTAVLTSAEETALGAWKQLAGAIGKAEPGVSTLNQLQADIFDLAPGLAKARTGKSGISIFGNNIVPKSVTGAGKDMAGRALQKTGEVVGNGASAASGVVNAIDQPFVRVGAPEAIKGGANLLTGNQGTTPTDTLPSSPSGVNFSSSNSSGGSVLTKQEAQMFAAADPRHASVYQQLSGPTVTADQAKSLGYADRVSQAEDTFQKYQNEASSTLFGIKKALPNVLKGNDAQLVDQAERNFINAVLRRESGAAIAPSEFDNAQKQYLPQPGDTPENLKQKAKNRQLVYKSLLLEGNSASPLPSSPAQVSF